jgi:hypothetical protein
MEKVKYFMRHKTLSDAFLAAGFLFAILALVFYLKTGITDFNPKINSAATTSLIVVLVLSFLLLFFGSKNGKYLAFLLVLYSFIQYLSSQATYIANVFVAIDGSTFSAGFIVTFLMYVFSFSFFLVSGILGTDEIAYLMEKEKTADEH